MTTSEQSPLPPPPPAGQTDEATRQTNTLKTDPYIGQLIDGKYRVISLLGSGGMGAVYKAEHSLMGRTVALKVLHPHLIENEDLLKRFQHEARIASKLHHPNAITTYDFGIYQGSPYLVMEYVEGRTLKALISEEGRLTPSRIIPIYLQVCAALSQAHDLGIVHRDLKPENIMLVPQPGGGESAVLLDFGIAKMLSQKSEQSRTILTQAGTFFGTPKYASPEQALEKNLDKRSDIYTLGIILYEALSGEVPFDAPSVMEILIKQLNKDAIPLRRFKPELNIPEPLDALVMKCLKKNPDDRYQNVEEFVTALKLCDSSSTSLGSGTFKKILFPLLALLLVCGGLYFWTSNRRTNESGKQQNKEITVRPTATPQSTPLPELTPTPEPTAAPQETQQGSSQAVDQPLANLAQQLLRSVEFDSTKNPSTPNPSPSMPESTPPEESEHSEIAVPSPAEIPATETPVETPATDLASPSPIPTADNVSEPTPSPEPTNENYNLRREMNNLNAGKKEAEEFYRSGRELYRQRRYAEAAKKFESAIQYRSDAIGSYISLGNCYMKLGKSEQALAAFLNAIKVEPSYGPAHYSLAGYYASQGETQKALESLERAVRLDPRARRFAADDPDLASLRQFPQFQAIIR
jgi:serine/threonine-protein kinase